MRRLLQPPGRDRRALERPCPRHRLADFRTFARHPRRGSAAACRRFPAAIVSRLSMRFLVTGISGQIGSEAARRFGELGDVVAADRAMLDLSRPSRLAAKLDALAPEVIVNPAAYTAVDRAEDERELAFTVNA